MYNKPMGGWDGWDGLLEMLLKQYLPYQSVVFPKESFQILYKHQTSQRLDLIT